MATYLGRIAGRRHFRQNRSALLRELRMSTRYLFLAVFMAAGLLARPALAAPFDNWAAMVIAGDWHAHSGAPSEVFDNARRDLSNDLAKMGFPENHIQQYSARPDADPAHPFHADPATIGLNFKRLTQQATGGCFVYLTTHGAPLGVAMGDGIVGLRDIGDLIDQSCPARPTVIVVSACFSGMFIPVLHADNRMIITAARGDRTSFGCGETNKYTFFDQCILESLPKSMTFPMLADGATECVAAREKAENVAPPSEPQVYIGSSIGSQLNSLTFSVN
jgi:hypothetical protein